MSLITAVEDFGSDTPGKPVDVLKRQTQELWLLSEARIALAHEMDLRSVCRAVVESTAQMFGYTQVSMYLLEGNFLNLQHQVGYDTPSTQIALDQGVIGRTVREGHPVLIENVQEERAYLSAISDVTSEICVPLFDQKRVVGAFSIESRGGIKLTEDDLRLMIALAEHVNVAIERTRLHSQVQRRNQILAALHETTLAIVNRLELPDLLNAILTKATQLLNTDHGYIALVEDDETGDTGMVTKAATGIFVNDKVPIRMGEGLGGRVWQTGQPIAVENYSAWPQRLNWDHLNVAQAGVVVPLKSSGAVIGVLGTTRVEPGETFSQEEVDLLTQFAELASITLDNARLYASAQQLYTAARQELVERKRIEEELMTINLELERAVMNAQELAIVAEAASNVKGQFLANMSHELRTPLSAVIGFNDILLATKLTDEQRPYVEQIGASAESLLKLLNDLLDVYKIDAGRIELERMDFELEPLVEQTIEATKPQAAAKNLALDSEITPQTPKQLTGDPIRLRQVLLNLLNNAIKFTDRGRISLRVECDYRTAQEATLHFVVSDTGIGVPRDKQALIFIPFSQADGSITRKYGGSGLGLTISRHLIEKFGGQLWVESDGLPGQGSRFHFTVTLGLMFQEDRVVSEPPIPVTPSLDKPRFKILLAEDNAINRQVITRMLEKRGWDVTGVEDGQAAVEALIERAFDIILMDIQMPVLDGLSAALAIRTRERDTGGHVPIVALTAYAMQGDRERCLAAGMDAYLPKPMRASELYAVIEETMSGAKVQEN